ncbi:phage terminase large subunit family protein [Telmatospirillum sp. J64-1]|uniref:phage terminase large subunit family protein n=1 Tax=Telmatospirillum sp. J64-1 TaxID=2502183 RepID=UPI00115D246B|nr:terminase gpA endonuclease subunit [Telmatospirillum sp. J64-1]
MTPRKALSVVAAALALGLAPPADVAPSAWAAENLVVPDGPKAGAKWDPATTPYLIEIIDLMGSTSLATRVVVRKSAQVGFTVVGQAWLCYIIDVAPAKTLMVLPTVPVAQDFAREKLNPTIEQSPAVRKKVRKQVSRSTGGSTSLNKRFPGGSIVITGANSSADLRSKTVKYVFADEVDDWPLDLDGQGDPMAMAEARQSAFEATADWKRLEGSTPKIKGASRIDEAFEAGDQRYWQVPCPHCGEYQKLTFFPDAEGKGGLRFNKEFPHNAWYACRNPECGVGVIEHHHKRAMVAAGKWVPEAPGPGRHPSFHIDALISNLTTWDKLAAGFLAAKDDPVKLKAFYNLRLGLAWEERGEAPEWQRLYARRGSYARRQVPPGGLIITTACDVQGDGIYYEVVAWGAGEVSWSIDAGFLPGVTDDPDNPVWRDLDALVARRYPDAYGNAWPADAFGIDSGYNSEVVKSWARRHHGVYALKGEDGWYRPALGTPSVVDITLGGKKKRRGAKVWPVGTWPLKSKWYALLRKPGIAEGEAEDPHGYCHFSQFHDEAYFSQVTSEYLKEVESKGRKVRQWMARGQNHLLDCRIYNMALAAHLGIPDMTPEQWAALRQVRAVPKPGAQGDLLAENKPIPADEEKPVRRDEPPAPAKDASLADLLA